MKTELSPLEREVYDSVTEMREKDHNISLSKALQSLGYNTSTYYNATAKLKAAKGLSPKKRAYNKAVVAAPKVIDVKTPAATSRRVAVIVCSAKDVASIISSL